MAIVTISHEIGAGGPEIGQQLAERLGYRYVDQELISNAAQRYGLLEEKLSHLDESKPSLFERFDAETRRYITVIQTALYEFAEQDNVVLMGRGGQWLLRGIPHVLRVRVMAPVRRAGQAARPRSSPGRWASRPTRAPSPSWCAATTPRRPGACATSTRWASPIRRSTTSSSTPRSSRSTAAVGLLAGVVGQPELADDARRAPSSWPTARSPRGCRWRWPRTRRRASTASRSRPRAGVVTLEGTAAMDEAMDVARERRGRARGEGAAGGASRRSRPSSPRRATPARSGLGGRAGTPGRSRPAPRRW